MAEASSSNNNNNNNIDNNENVSLPTPTVQENRQTQQPSVLYRIRISLSDHVGPTERDDALSCLVIILTFWFFASMTLILGVYGSTELTLGPNTSRLIQANSILLQDLKVKNEEGTQNKLMFYGFHKLPPLDVPVFWSEMNNISIPPSFHKDWVYYLNTGSEINISYAINYEGSYPVNLIIAKGKEEILQWVDNPSQPSNTLSWNLIYGNGTISQKIEKPSEYFIAVGNLNNLPAEVQLEFRISAVLYNTTEAYYRCSLEQRQCTFELTMLKPAFAILSTGLIKESNAFYVKLSYGPRWAVYFIGSAVMTLVILLAYKIINNLCNHHTAFNEAAENNDQQTPLLTNKDDENSSLGSSYESVSHDEEDVEEWLKTEAVKFLEEGGSSHLCTVCCDAPRDCFFLPCGHSATCYACGERISDEAGTCPICRRRMKKVRRIFSV